MRKVLARIEIALPPDPQLHGESLVPGTEAVPENAAAPIRPLARITGSACLELTISVCLELPTYSKSAGSSE